MAIIQKTVLITGCSAGGIGDALAQCFQKHGFHVFATARNLGKIEHLGALGMTLLTIDVEDQKSIEQAVEAVTAATGGTLDVLINSSGGGYTMPLLDVDIKAAKKLYDVNVWGLLATTQAFVPLLIAAKGTIVNIGSTAGTLALPYRGIYTSSKAVVHLMTDTLRIELKPFEVKVICLIAGPVTSNFNANLPQNSLPQSSIYQIARMAVEKGMGSLPGAGTPISAESFAESTVRNVLRKNPTVFHWIGQGTFMTWILSTVMWHTFGDLVLPGMYGLNDVAKAYRASKNGI